MSDSKLIPNLLDKKQYVVHYRNLQFYMKQGPKLNKIHKVISFTQSNWLKPWIDLCTSQRQNAKSDFEADLVKLQANSTYGKTMENARNRQNIRLIADPAKLLKAFSKPSYQESKIINADLVMVRASRRKVTLNKPIAVGFPFWNSSDSSCTNSIMCTLNQNTGTAVDSSLQTRTRCAAKFRHKIFTKTWPKILTCLTRVILTLPTLSTQPIITEYLARRNLKQTPLFRWNLLALEPICTVCLAASNRRKKPKVYKIVTSKNAFSFNVS